MPFFVLSPRLRSSFLCWRQGSLYGPLVGHQLRVNIPVYRGSKSSFAATKKKLEMTLVIFLEQPLKRRSGNGGGGGSVLAVFLGLVTRNDLLRECVYFGNCGEKITPKAQQHTASLDLKKTHWNETDELGMHTLI